MWRIIESIVVADRTLYTNRSTALTAVDKLGTLAPTNFQALPYVAACDPETFWIK